MRPKGVGALSAARCTQTDRSNRKRAGLFNGLVLMDDRSQKPAQGREEWPQLPQRWEGTRVMQKRVA